MELSPLFLALTTMRGTPPPINCLGFLDRGILLWDARFQGTALGIGQVYNSSVGWVSTGSWVHLVATWRNEEESYNKTINRLMEEDGSTFATTRELIYTNPKTSEIIYQLTFNKTDIVETVESETLEN